jgi:hypothetical protein
MFRQLLIWAVAEGYTEKMPGSGVKVAGVGKTNPAERRNPYSMDQLKAIFNSPLFTGHRSEKCRHEPGKMLIRDGKFWLPLIALYSGLRMGEIVQLMVAGPMLAQPASADARMTPKIDRNGTRIQIPKIWETLAWRLIGGFDAPQNCI